MFKGLTRDPHIAEMIRNFIPLIRAFEDNINLCPFIKSTPTYLELGFGEKDLIRFLAYHTLTADIGHDYRLMPV